jgi:hypothetical protein
MLASARATRELASMGGDHICEVVAVDEFRFTGVIALYPRAAEAQTETWEGSRIRI